MNTVTLRPEPSTVNIDSLNSMWFFLAHRMIIISVSFWSRAKVKDSYSIDMIIYESLSAKILNIIKSCTIDFYSADK